jgi:hypothetical protein
VVELASNCSIVWSEISRPREPRIVSEPLNHRFAASSAVNTSIPGGSPATRQPATRQLLFKQQPRTGRPREFNKLYSATASGIRIANDKIHYRVRKLVDIKVVYHSLLGLASPKQTAAGVTVTRPKWRSFLNGAPSRNAQYRIPRPWGVSRYQSRSLVSRYMIGEPEPRRPLTKDAARFRARESQHFPFGAIRVRLMNRLPNANVPLASRGVR